MGNKMFQVSTLHALVAGYTRAVITVQELESRGNVGLTGEAAPFDLREDPPLTAKGRLQADLLGQLLAGVDFDAVYSIRVDGDGGVTLELLDILEEDGAE